MSEVEFRITEPPPPATGLPYKTLLQIAVKAKVLQYMSEYQTREAVIDYVEATTAEMKFVEGDPLITPIAPTTIVPIRIVYRLEDQMFGGDTFFTLTADGHAMMRPLMWESFEKLGSYVLTG